jgi:CheY-like chemotaxis protein
MGMFFWKKKNAKSQNSSSGTKTESQHTGAPRKKILVVDDDPVTVKTLTLTLNAQGYNVLSAVDGSAAIRILRQQNPDMMLVDVSLSPDVARGGMVPWTGFQMMGWLQRMNTRIPTIIISGSDKPEYKEQAAAVGADGFMAKPINSTALLSSIASALAKIQPAAAFSGLKLLD